MSANIPTPKPDGSSPPHRDGEGIEGRGCIQFQHLDRALGLPGDPAGGAIADCPDPLSLVNNVLYRLTRFEIHATLSDGLEKGASDGSNRQTPY